MKAELVIQIASVPDRERCVAELWYGLQQVAEVSFEDTNVNIEIYSQQDGLPWRFLHNEFLQALERAKALLEDKDQ